MIEFLAIYRCRWCKSYAKGGVPDYDKERPNHRDHKGHREINLYSCNYSNNTLVTILCLLCLLCVQKPGIRLNSLANFESSDLPLYSLAIWPNKAVLVGP